MPHALTFDAVPSIAPLIPKRWQPTLSHFARRDGDPPELRADGSWSLRVEGSLAPAHELVAHAPQPFDVVLEGREPMFDGAGNDVDDERTYGVWACRSERAVFSWTDHFQAGLYATLTVYPDERAFEDAISSRKRELERSAYDEEERA